MPTNPPKVTTTFATDGGADAATPTDAEISTGFRKGDTTDFNQTLNYSLNRLCGWGDFLGKTLAPDVAARNITWTDIEDPFTGGNATAGLYIRYDDLADKWYASSSDLSTGSNIRCFDSDDGITWSAEKKVITIDTNDESFSPIYSNGTVCAMAATEHSGPTAKFFVSTDNTVANMSAAAGSFVAIKYVRDMLWDPFTSKWYVIGLNSATTQGYLEWSDDNGATWNNVAGFSTVDNPRAFATDGLGYSYCVMDDSTSHRYSSGGMDGTWTAKTHSLAFVACTFLPGKDYFLLVSSVGSVFLQDRNAFSVASWDTDYDAKQVLVGGDLNLIIGDTGVRSTAFEITSIVEAKGHQNYNLRTLGFLPEDFSANITANHKFTGNSSRIVWTYGTSDKLAYTDFGPSGLT
jgi:hypothetical protein